MGQIHRTPNPMAADRPVPRYADLFDAFSPEEQTLLPQLKRFFEVWEGDQQFRNSVAEQGLTEEQRALLKEIGVMFDVDQLSPLWTMQDTFVEALANPEAAEPSAEIDAILAKNPILDLWRRFSEKKTELYITQRHFCQTSPSKSAKYSAWRQRRIAATKSELGTYGYAIDHPALALELAVGCTVGCYFCAFDAQKLTKVFDYTVPENRELFRGIGTSLRDVLGWSSGHALLYWSTEPADNPHYIDFMRDYEEVTGATVCTATARADETWVGGLMEFYRRGPLPWPRISVLTRSIMYKLHRRFTPEESRDMLMLMQQKDSEEIRTKVPGGRDKMLARLETYTDLRELDVEERPGDVFVPQGSIACVSGFLMNIIDRTIKLISPCYTTEHYRYGYRVFDEVTFTDAADFDRKLRDMIERKMVVDPYAEMPMRFRDDLRYRPREDGFLVSSRNQVHKFTGNEMYRRVGELLHRGDLTYAQVCDDLTDGHGFNPMQVAAMLKGLFDRGFLDEMTVVAPGAPAADGAALAYAGAE